MLVNYKIKKILPKIYAIKVKDPYERAMLFMRVQEFYESQFPEIKGQSFDVFEYMNIYRKWAKKSYFSYPDDWIGFNVPGNIVEAATDKALGARSGTFPTPYDNIMKEIIDVVKKDLGPKTKYYLLGVDKFKSKLMDHEICHGLYYTDQDYKKSCDAIIDETISEKNREKLKKIIIKMGYDESVVDDEIQAYLSTGVHPEMKKIKGINTIAEKFRKNFKKYKKKHDIDS